MWVWHGGGELLWGVDLGGFETLSSLFPKTRQSSFLLPKHDFFLLQYKIKASGRVLQTQVSTWSFSLEITAVRVRYCCNTLQSLFFFFALRPVFSLWHSALEAAQGMIFHTTMHLTSVGAEGTQQFRRGDLSFSVYRCISKLDFRHVRLEMFDLKSFSPFGLLPGLIWSLL